MVAKVAGGVVLTVILVLGTELMIALTRDFIRRGPEWNGEGRFGVEPSPKLRFVVLGDSTAVGLGADSPKQTYPWLLASALGGNYQVELKVLGESGAQVTDVKKEQLPAALRLDPDLVLIEIGANDATHATRKSSVRRDMVYVLDALQQKGIKVVIVGPPHMGTSRAFAQPLRALSGWRGHVVQDAIRAAAVANGLEMVDLEGPTAPAFRNDPNRYYSKDMFHPGPEGYKLWAETMLPAVKKAAAEIETQ